MRKREGDSSKEPASHLNLLEMEQKKHFGASHDWLESHTMI